MAQSSQQFGKTYASANKSLSKRYQITLDFIEKHVQKDMKILDLGIENPLSKLIKKAGYQVENSAFGVDLDLDYSVVEKKDYDIVTAFEIFEHLVSPFTLLRNIKSNYLMASVPLAIWFSKAYWNEKDPWDRHFHEFEPRQFDMLLNKAGWRITDSHKWASGNWKKLGVRPILRHFTPRYYLVFCERIKND